MSVLKAKRTVSKAEFVNTANQIYVETLNFLTRMSARYARLLAEPVAKLAGEVVDHCEKANSIFPSDEQRINLRKAHLLEARASLKALDVRLTHCYTVMMQRRWYLYPVTLITSSNASLGFIVSATIWTITTSSYRMSKSLKELPELLLSALRWPALWSIRGSVKSFL